MRPAARRWSHAGEATSAWLAGVTCVAGVAGVAGVAWPALAHAEDALDLEASLEEPVVTTASKSAESAGAAPGRSTVLTAEDLRVYGLRTLADAIDFLSVGAVSANPLHAVDLGARGVMIPGDQGNHFLLLIDGHAMNDPLVGAARFDFGLAVPLEMIDHIEVLTGPGSVLYGSNAMLGVINVITKQAKHWSGGHVAAEWESPKSSRVGAGLGWEFELFGAPAALTSAVGYERLRGASFDFRPQDYGIDITSQAPFRFSRSGPATGVWGGVASHSYTADVPTALVRFTAGGLEVGLHASLYRRSTPYSNFDALSDFDDPDGFELDRALRVDVKYTRVVSPILKLSARLYGDSFDDKTVRNVSTSGACLADAPRTCSYTTVGSARWAGLELQGALDWFRDARLVTLVGVEPRVLSVAHVSDTRDYATGLVLLSSTDVIHAHAQTIGAYLQQQWEPSAYLSANAGVRLDADPRFSPVLSPRVAAALRAWKEGTIRLVFSSAYRAPTYLETDSAAPDQLAARSLQPERVRSLEATVEQKIGPHRLFVDVFRSWWTNLVELHELSAAEVADARARGEIAAFGTVSASQFRNISSIDGYGIDGGLEGAGFTRRLRYGLTYTAAYARRVFADGTTQLLTVTPSVFGNARASWDFGGAWPTAGLALHWMGPRVVDGAYQATYPTLQTVPSQLEVRATLSGPVPHARGLSYRLSVNYALNDRAPYFAGPFQRSVGLTAFDPTARVAPDFAPVERLRVLAGLQWDFLGSEGR